MPLPCCGGRGAGGADVVLNAKFEEVKIPKQDEIYTEASGLLDQAEAIRSGLDDAKADMMVLSGAAGIKDGKLTDALTLFLASVGTDNGADKLAAPKIDMSASPPVAMELPGDCKLSDEQSEFKAALECYVKTLVSAPDSLKTLGEGLSGVSTKASEAAGTVKDDATEAGLGAMDAAKAVKACGSNSKALATAAGRLPTLTTTCTSGAEDVKGMATGMSDILTKAKELAGKADKAKSKMADIAPLMEGKTMMKPDEVKKSEFTKLRNARIEGGRSLPAGDAPAPAAKKDDAPAAEEKKDDEAKPEDVKADIADV